MSRWLVGSSRMSSTESSSGPPPGRPPRAPGPARPAWPGRPTAVATSASIQRRHAEPVEHRLGLPALDRRRRAPCPAGSGASWSRSTTRSAPPAPHGARFGCVAPARTRSSVDLPLPFRPTTASRSPLDSVTDTSANSGRPGREAARPEASSRITSEEAMASTDHRSSAHLQLQAESRELLRRPVVAPLEVVDVAQGGGTVGDGRRDDRGEAGPHVGHRNVGALQLPTRP